MERDYALLRPFDQGAAEAGAMCCWYGNAQEARYVAGPDPSGRVAIEWTEGNGRVCIGHLEVVPVEKLRMAPLTWLERRPVYKGDVLYSGFFEHEFEVTGTDARGQFKAEKVSPCAATKPRSCSWSAPTVEKANRQVELIAYLDARGALIWRDSTSRQPVGCRRVPSEDKTVEVQS